MSIILVSGTSRGLGAHLVADLTARGHIVYGSSRSGGDDARHLRLDVTEPEACRQAVATVVEREGRLDAIINNAGSHLLGAAMETTHEELRAQLELNFHGAVHLTSAALPHLVEQGGGRVINVSSVGGRFATPFTSAYSASKFALEGYMEALRLELLPLGVFVTNLEPAFLATGTTERSIHQVAREHPRFAGAREAAHGRMLHDGARGLPLARVAAAVAKVLHARHPPFRLTIDGFATRLALSRALTPSWLFERIVLRQTAPELVDAG